MATKEKIDFKKRLIHFGIGIMSAAFVMMFSLLPIYRDLESRLYDQRFMFRGDTYMDPNIATINIDAETLESEGRYQDWTRDKYYQIIKRIHEMGARMIGFDVFFPEPSTRLIKVDDVNTLIDSRNENDSGDGSEVQLNASDLKQLSPDYDADMVDIIKYTGNVILGQSFVPSENQDTEYIINNTMVNPKHAKTLEKLKEFSVDFPEWEDSPLSRYEGIEPPIDSYMEVCKGIGYAQTEADEDGSVRRYPLILVYNKRIFPSLALMMICEYLNVDLQTIEIKPGSKVLLPNAVYPDSSVKNIEIPIDSRGKMLVNWVGDWTSPNFHHVSHVAITGFSDLIQKENILKRLKTLSLTDKDILDPEIFINSLDKYGFESGDMVTESYTELIGSHYSYEMIKAKKELTVEGFLEKYPMFDESWFENVQQNYEEIKYNHRILEVLQAEPGLNLEEVAEKINEKNYDKVLRGYALMKHLIEEGGPRREDYPLMFSAPNIDRKVYLPEDIKDKIFFYGLTAAGTWDLNPMPFNDRYPMLGLHANAFNTIVTGQFLKKLSTFGNWGVILLLGILLGAVIPLFKPIKSAMVVTVLIVGYVIFGQWMFQSAGMWIDVLGPLMVIIASYMAITVYNFFSEEKEKKMIRGIFSRYVTKSVVDELIKNPEMVKLGGEKRELTVFFSDVTGFTTISESLTPEELVGLLNEYLTAMTTIVLEYDGMIDKYEGDAIMAVFGAPVPYKDHAVRACKVSIDMQKRLAELRDKWREEGKPELTARIGVNTGPMVVGNMGAMDRLDYTVMGDSVNLGSRLEGANKQYGTFMMISEYTLEHVKNEIETRFLDSLRVKGKKLPVKVYEILETKERGVQEEKKKTIELYEKGIGFYLNKDWDKGIEAFENALAADPEDAPSKVYLSRCRDFKINPPPDDWDGVYVMTTK